MPLYSIDVMICATAYIKADSPEAALAIANKLAGDSPTIQDNWGDLPICGMQYSDPDLPDVSLSPAMTIQGPVEGAEPDLVDGDNEGGE